LYHLSRVQETVVPMATANIMVPLAVPKQIKKTVITAAFHSVRMKHRSLVSPSENACARKAASIVAPTRSGSRSSKLQSRKCCSFFVHCIVAKCWYVTSLNLSRIASFKRSWELLLEVSTWLYILSITLKLNNKKKCEVKCIFHYKTFKWQSHLLSLIIDTHGPNLWSDF
jgi:hypothetical protein